MKKKETVCLDDTQMKNIIDAARADVTGQTKKVCPKALKFVRGYHPKKKIQDTAADVEKWIDRKITQKARAFVDGFF